MKISFADLWRPSGNVDRGTYAVVGLVGFAIKHNLDRMIASFGFHRPWRLFNYWVPAWDVARITDLRGREAVFLATMVAVALPFIWIGVVLTLKRLRSAGLPTHLVALFFVPFLNLLFFVLLCVLPERKVPATDIAVGEPERSYLARVVPEGKLGSAAAALIVTVPLGLGLTVLGAQLLQNYGWGLFVAAPFVIGFTATLVYGVRQPRSMPGCVGVACLSTSLLGLALLALALEGTLCLIMAMPIALPLAALGGVCGYYVQKRSWYKTNAPAFLSIVFIFVPGVQWAERAIAPAPETFVVRSSIDIDASPELVWRKVVAFTEIPPPTEWMFRAGIAYPIRAEMLGTGPGAERHCVFSTGAFVEPIEVWDEPHRLKFSVSSNPAPMEEWTPYSHIEPPHLHGFLVSKGGQFLLTPLPGGRTRLQGTTWYQHGLWPAPYWRLWSDAIIHRIHLRVLRHIRDEVESERIGRES